MRKARTPLVEEGALAPVTKPDPLAYVRLNVELTDPGGITFAVKRTT